MVFRGTLGFREIKIRAQEDISLQYIKKLWEELTPTFP
jgi:hypothetical protein